MKISFKIFCLVILLPLPGISQCKVKSIVGGCKPNLNPYGYDSYAITDIDFGDHPQKLEVQFTAFAHQKYKLVFCTSGFEENVRMNIYDKSNRVKNRQKVYDGNDGIDNVFWSFVPPKSGDYFIEYEVPAVANGEAKSGCVILIVGVQLQEDAAKK